MNLKTVAEVGILRGLARRCERSVPSVRSLGDWLIIYAVSANLASWLCAWMGWLRAPVHVWSFVLLFMFLLSRLLSGSSSPAGVIPRLRFRRFKKILPLLYFFTFGLVLLSVFLHPEPSNYDHLTYRFPRLLHWWSQGEWFWIEGADQRLNYSGVGFEWMWYPLFLLTRSDIGVVLLNLLSFALLPGLIFRVYVKLGISPRIAAMWMWVLPAAYCFVMQAGGAGNDLIGAVFALAACNGLLGGQRDRWPRAVGVGLLAAALLSGIKLSNAPLLLPLGFLFISRQDRCAFWRLRFVPVLVAGVMVSFVPMFVLNIANTGDYSGDPENTGRMRISSPLAGISGNILQTGVAAVSPPVNPLAGKCNALQAKAALTRPMQWLRRSYPRFSLRVREVVGEEDGGLGIGVSVFLLLLLVTARKHERATVVFWRDRRIIALILFCVAYGILIMKLGSEAIPRIAAPYYPFVVAFPFLGLRCRHIRYPRTIRVVGAIGIALSWAALILTPSRPLYPWQAVLEYLPENSHITARMRDVYTLYAERADALAPIKAAATDWREIRKIGVVGFEDVAETSLWRPFDGRTVHYILPGKLRQDQAFAFDLVLGRQDAIEQLLQAEEWRQWTVAFKRADVRFAIKAQAGEEEWVVLRGQR